ncbi:MAG: tRNA preQ1(34) S-adenosylmethionine ribosyltransferase-isomerase QueA [Microcoleaceae cyanobacterium]
MKQLDWTASAYDYSLPTERIAQNPVVPRDHSRLLVVDSPETHHHHWFKDLPNLLQSGDLLVLNDTRVLAARLYGRKTSGAEIEVLLLEEQQQNCWLALVKPGKRLKVGSRIEFESIGTFGKATSVDSSGLPSEILPKPVPLTAEVIDIDPSTGGRFLQFNLPSKQSLIPILNQFGHLPLPPYITESQAQSEQYQTIYARSLGAVAAPTAGLHFTDPLFEQLQQQEIQTAFITLHVGVGTFRPVEVEEITAHQMHSEWVEVPAETVEKIHQTQQQGGRVIAVGTTVVRALEGVTTDCKQLVPFCGRTNLFIYPGYQWKVVQGLITNFHLPRSSLLMLVAALVGRERLLELYQVALDEPAGKFGRPYRFYSFGDAMLILPEAKLAVH